MTLTAPLKWHGGKHYLASRIVALMPPRCTRPNAPQPGDGGWCHYVEPYAGGLSVLLANDPEGISEVVNDINYDVANFWETLWNDFAFDEFRQKCEATPFSDRVWRTACKVLEQPLVQTYGHDVERVWAFFVCCRMSLAGRMDAFAPLSRTRTRRGMNEQASAWLGAVDGLAEVHQRLRRVVVLNRPAQDVIREEDGHRTLFYLDPPYLHEIRATTGEYAYEMSAQDHADLLVTLGGKQLAEAIVRHKCAEIEEQPWWDSEEPISGRFLLSGYRSALYELGEMFGWKRHEFDLPNHSAGGKSKRRMTECVWTNY